MPFTSIPLCVEGNGQGVEDDAAHGRADALRECHLESMIETPPHPSPNGAGAFKGFGKPVRAKQHLSNLISTIFNRGCVKMIYCFILPLQRDQIDMKRLLLIVPILILSYTALLADEGMAVPYAMNQK